MSKIAPGQHQAVSVQRSCCAFTCRSSPGKGCRPSCLAYSNVMETAHSATQVACISSVARLQVCTHEGSWQVTNEHSMPRPGALPTGLTCRSSAQSLQDLAVRESQPHQMTPAVAFETSRDPEAASLLNGNGAPGAGASVSRHKKSPHAFGAWFMLHRAHFVIGAVVASIVTAVLWWAISGSLSAGSEARVPAQPSAQQNILTARPTLLLAQVVHRWLI
jgi:hypothetical protein